MLKYKSEYLNIYKGIPKENIISIADGDILKNNIGSKNAKQIKEEFSLHSKLYILPVDTIEDIFSIKNKERIKDN